MKLHRLTIFLLTVYSVSSFKRVCYYTNWSHSRPLGGRFTPEDINPYLCTHIIFAYARIVSDEILPTEWNDENTQHATGLYEKVTSLKNINPDLKVILGVGGWNTVSLLASWPNAHHFRTKFIDSTIAYLRRRNFDGIDLNWAGPTARRVRPVKREIFTDLLEELRNGFEEEANSTGNEPLLLTAAVSAERTDIENRYDVPRLARLLDFINVMTLDLQGSWASTLEHHSPLFPRRNQIGDDRYRNVEEAMLHWIDLGAPNSKLLVGIPFYGRTFQALSADQTNMGDPDTGVGPASHYTMQNGFISYYEVCELLNSGATQRWHNEHKVPYLINGTTWVAYDNKRSITEKTKWLKANQFGGSVVWALDSDDFLGDFCNEGPCPLMQTIYDQLNLKRDSSKDIKSNRATPMKTNFEAKTGLGQQMTETMQVPIKQSNIGHDADKKSTLTKSEVFTTSDEPIPTNEELAMINGGLKNDLSTDTGTHEKKMKSEYGIVGSQRKIHKTLYEQVKPGDGISDSYLGMTLDGSQNSKQKPLAESKSTKHILSEFSVMKSSDPGIMLNGGERNTTGSSAASTETQTLKDETPNLPGTKSNNAKSGFSKLPFPANGQPDPNAFYETQGLSGNQLNSETSTNEIPTVKDGVYVVGYHDTDVLNKNTLLNNLNSLSTPTDDTFKASRVHADPSQDKTIVLESLNHISKEKVSKGQYIAGPMVPGGELMSDSRTDSAATRDSLQAIQNNKFDAKNVKPSSDRVIILPLNPVKEPVNAESQSQPNNQGAQTGQPNNEKPSTSNIGIGIDLTTAERHIYDISPSIRNAVPKVMTVNERKTYAGKANKQRQKFIKSTKQNVPEGMTDHNRISLDENQNIRAQANKLISNSIAKDAHIESPVQNQRSLTDTSTLLNKRRMNQAGSNSPNKVSDAKSDTSPLLTTRTMNLVGITKSYSPTKVSDANSNRRGRDKPKSSLKRQRNSFSIEKSIPMKRTYNRFSSRNANKDNMISTNEFGVPYSTLCKYYWYVLCFDHIDKVYMHGKDWKTVKGVYVKPENYTTTPDPNEIIVHHAEHIEWP